MAYLWLEKRTNHKKYSKFIKKCRIIDNVISKNILIMLNVINIYLDNITFMWYYSHEKR